MRCGRLPPRCSRKRLPTRSLRGEWIGDRAGRMGTERETYDRRGVHERTPGGEWFLYVEASPAPRAPSWPEPPRVPAVGVSRRPPTTRRSKRWVTFSPRRWRCGRATPLDVVSRSANSPTARGRQRRRPPFDRRLCSQRCAAEIEELHETGALEGAVSSRRGPAAFNHNTIRSFFTGDLRSRLVLVHHNRCNARTTATTYVGDFEFDETFDE